MESRWNCANEKKEGVLGGEGQAAIENVQKRKLQWKQKPSFVAQLHRSSKLRIRVGRGQKSVNQSKD